MMTLDIYFAKAHEFLNHASDVVDDMFGLVNDENLIGNEENKQIMKFVQLSTDITILESLIHAVKEQTQELSDISSIKELTEKLKVYANGKK